MTTLVASTTGNSEALGINHLGVVVGRDEAAQPFVWEPHQPNGTVGTITRLPLLPTGGAPGEGTAMAINKHGVIAGRSDAMTAGGLVTRGAVWIPGSVLDIGTLMPDPLNPGAFLGNSRAIDINDAGLVVGASDTAFGVEHAILFDPSTGRMSDLGALIPLGASRATSLNSVGDIVGVSDALDASGNPVERAFLLPGAAAMIDLGTLVPDPSMPGSFLENSGAFGINDNDAIVGTSDAGGGLSAAVRFPNPPAPTSFLPQHSDGFDVGPADQVVGTFGANLDRAFVFHSSVGFVDLSAITGRTVTSATGVNAVGQVAAVEDVGGVAVAILITP